MRGAGRETAVSWGARATCHAYYDIPNDWIVGIFDADARTHSNARFVWSLSVYGDRFAQGAAIFRSHYDYIDAQ